MQIFDENQALAFGFDVLDPTKIIPEEYAPLRPLGVLRLDTNPVNYFAETEQIMVSCERRANQIFVPQTLEILTIPSSNRVTL